MPGRIQRLSSFYRAPAARDLTFTAGSKGAGLLLGLLGNVLSTRALGVAEFGKFSMLMALITVVGTLADAGLTYSAIRLIARHSSTEPERAKWAAHVYFVLRMGTGAALTLLTLLLSGLLASLILGDITALPYLQISSLTLLSLAISSYPGTILIGLSRFKRLAAGSVLNAIITVGGIAALAVTGNLNLLTLVAWNAILPIASNLPLWLMLPKGWLPTAARQEAETASPQVGVLSFKKTARELVGFGKWMGLSLLAQITVAQGDVLLLGRLLGPSAAGIYSVALSLASRLDMLNQSLFLVMMPRASKLIAGADMRAYAGRVLRGAGALACAVAGIALVSQPVIMLLYGARYAASQGLFLGLLGVVVFDLATSSLFLLAFPLNKPRTLAVADWLRVVVLLGVGGLLIPRLGAWGAVAARLSARLSGTSLTLWELRRAIGVLPEETLESDSHPIAGAPPQPIAGP